MKGSVCKGKSGQLIRCGYYCALMSICTQTLLLISQAFKKESITAAQNAKI